jgi:protein-L-isoaspartate(D-aspartate) O-methyltransferase
MMADMNIEKARHNMVEQQIRPWDVLDQQVLDLMLRVPREDFVPAEYRKLAFTDMALPIGQGEVMMEPKLEARMLQSLAVRPTDKVLEVGTGSGYVTALLASLAAEVVSVEINAELLEQAHQRLAAHGIDNIALEQGDAADGWDKAQPYDVICVTGSQPVLSQGLKENLQIGGRLFAVIGEKPVMEAVLVTRVNANEWRTEVLFETVVPPLRGVSRAEPFVF